MEALRGHDAGIIMIAVGVGSGIDQNELEAIASEPICLHLYLLKNFDEVDDLKYAIEKRTCDGRWAIIRRCHAAADDDKDDDDEDFLP